MPNAPCTLLYLKVPSGQVWRCLLARLQMWYVNIRLRQLVYSWIQSAHLHILVAALMDVKYLQLSLLPPSTWEKIKQRLGHVVLALSIARYVEQTLRNTRVTAKRTARYVQSCWHATKQRKHQYASEEQLQKTVAGKNNGQVSWETIQSLQKK